MEYYGYHGRITAQEGKRNQLVDILLEAAELLQKNQNCFHYVVGVSGKNDIWISELWRDKESHDASLNPEEIRALIMSARPHIKDMGNAVEATVCGGKGIPS